MGLTAKKCNVRKLTLQQHIPVRDIERLRRLYINLMRKRDEDVFMVAVRKPVTKLRAVWGIILSISFVILGVFFIELYSTTFQRFLGGILIVAGLMHIPYVAYVYFKGKKDESTTPPSEDVELKQ